jgi:hypothetical protein
LARIQARRPSQSETLPPLQSSLASSSQSDAAHSSSNYESTSPYTSPESSPIPGHAGPPDDPCGIYNPFTWIGDATATPFASPSWSSTVPPTMPSTQPTATTNPFAVEPTAWTGTLPSHPDGSFLSMDELHELMNCPFSGPCYHAGGTCLCHPPLNSNELQALMSSALVNATQYPLPDGSVPQMAPMSYPEPPHNRTYPTFAGHGVDSEFCARTHHRGGYSLPILPRLCYGV